MKNRKHKTGAGFRPDKGVIFAQYFLEEVQTVSYKLQSVLPFCMKYRKRFSENAVKNLKNFNVHRKIFYVFFLGFSLYWQYKQRAHIKCETEGRKRI
ncbi:hypothetical protein B5G33_08705 [Blautia sp. An81]|nr:hypothetical protein B5G33_08705 [Blautia sp. An81]